MSRNLLQLLAAGGALGLTTSAFAQGVNIDEPEDSTGVERTGRVTQLQLDVDADGSADGTAMSAGDDIDYFFEIVGLKATGTTTLWPETQIPDAQVDFNQDGTFGDPGNVPAGPADFTATVDLGFGAFDSALTAAINAADLDGGFGDLVVVVRVKDQNGNENDTEVVDSEPDGTHDAAGEAALVDDNPLMISDVFLDEGNESFFIVFSRSLRFTGGLPGGGTFDTDNGTSPADANAIALTDLRLSTDDTFGTPIALTGSLNANPDYVTGSDNTLAFDLTGDLGNMMGSQGQFLRIENTGLGADVLGNDLADDTNGAEISDLEAFAVEEVTAITSITSAGAGIDAIKVTYNLPVDATDVGDVGAGSFYGEFLQVDGEDSDISLVAANIDPNNPNCVILTVNAGGTDLIWADGLATDGSTYSLQLNGAAGSDPPSSIFGSDISTDTTSDVGDGTEASVDDFSFHDLDGDGALDAVAIIFDEPVTPNGVTAANFTLDILGVNTFPFDLIGQDGSLNSQTNVADTDALTITDVTTAGVRLENTSGAPARIENGNAVVIQFDNTSADWDGMGTGSPPGTADAAIAINYDNGGTFEDAAGNSSTIGAVSAETADVDRAPPVLAKAAFFTGDNQPSTSNLQYFREISDGDPGDTTPESDDLGDATSNNRFAFFASEELDFTSYDEDGITYGPNNTQFLTGDSFGFAIADDNGDVLGFNISSPNEDLAAGNDFNIASSAGLTDTAGNEFAASGTIEDCVSTYLPYSQALDGSIVFAGFLVDSDDDGFANEARLSLTAPVDDTTVDTSDFTVSGFSGVVTNAAVDSGNARVVVLTFTDGEISMANTVSITYNGSTDMTLIARSDTGKAVSDVDATFTVSDVVEPAADTQNVAIMPLVGTITTDGTTPAPRGTKIFAMTAVPTAWRATAEHNSVFFTVNDEGSREAFTNWLLGLEAFVYLIREDDNEQFYDNEKFGTDELTFDQVIDLDINANNLSSIRFSGTGETNDQRVRSGELSLCWDVLRSGDGTMANFYRNGFEIGGAPVLSSTVVKSDDGSYSMHVSAPSALFDGREVLDSVGYPVIMVVELPSGERFVCSNLLTSADTVNLAGGPLLFSPNNTFQENSAAPNAAQFSCSLDDVGTQTVFPGWNLEGFPRESGWASSNGNRPQLPEGLTDDDIVVGTGLPAVGPINQFAFWLEDTVDGQWNSSDDSSALLDGIVIDSKCFSNFWFNMTSFGVRTGSVANQLVGGYGFGFFNNTTSTYGLFQVGDELNSTFIFADGAFPNNSTTQGWFLGTNTGGDLAPTSFFTNNTDVDYIITFENSGNGNIEVTSHANGAAGNPNDTTEVSDNQAIFGHANN